MTGRDARALDLVFVGHRCCDHSPNSGYDQVCALFPEAGWLHGPALEAGRLEWHRERQGAAATTAPLFHVFYGDCSGRRLPAILRERFPGAPIISSVHKPVARLLEDPVARQAVEASDAIITVSQVQANALAPLRLPGAVHAIPHGVWTRVFRPAAPSARPRADVLIVGSFLRDWDGASRVIMTLAQHGVRSVAVGAGAREHLRREDLPVEVLPRVSEGELAALYDGAAAVFLPFLDATASNALVEAMAAGCPVVCPRFPSLVNEYLLDDSDAFEVGRYDDAAERLLRYARRPADRDLRSRELMTRAEAFDWARLKPRYEAVYENVAASADIAYGLV
jgi:glycosyltransferase involved in cell wall biosynthesis